MRSKAVAVALGFLLLVGSGYSQKTAVQDDRSTKTMQTPIADPKDATGPAHPIPVPPPRATASAPSPVTDSRDLAVEKAPQEKQEKTSQKKGSKKTDSKRAKQSNSASEKPEL